MAAGAPLLLAAVVVHSQQQRGAPANRAGSRRAYTYGRRVHDPTCHRTRHPPLLQAAATLPLPLHVQRPRHHHAADRDADAKVPVVPAVSPLGPQLDAAHGELHAAMPRRAAIGRSATAKNTAAGGAGRREVRQGSCASVGMHPGAMVLTGSGALRWRPAPPSSIVPSLPPSRRPDSP